MKNKIFEKMKEYGWNLGNGTSKDFAKVYDIHYKFIDNLLKSFGEQYYIEGDINLNKIDKENLFETIVFMSDFLGALNDVDTSTILGNKCEKDSSCADTYYDKHLKRLEDLDKEELLKFIKEYDNYVITFYKEHDSGSIPVCIYEFYYNDYQMLKEELK